MYCCCLQRQEAGVRSLGVAQLPVQRTCIIARRYPPWFRMRSLIIAVAPAVIDGPFNPDALIVDFYSPQECANNFASC